MKPTRREENIFSVSAIDLFASALGAFVVVAIALLPYFPNTGQAAASRSATAKSSLEALPPLDLIIALDTTASMMGEVASLREEIAGLSELLVDLTEDAAVGIIAFKDGCGGAPALRIAPLQPVDEHSVGQLTAFARSLSPGSAPCNTTADEDFAEALAAAVDAEWRSTSERKSIVMISDNPAHDHLREQAVASARGFAGRIGARHTVSTVFVSGPMRAGRSYPDTAQFMERVAQAGDGQFVRSDENASLAVTILRAIFDD